MCEYSIKPKKTPNMEVKMELLNVTPSVVSKCIPSVSHASSSCGGTQLFRGCTFFLCSPVGKEERKEELSTNQTVSVQFKACSDPSRNNGLG